MPEKKRIYLILALGFFLTLPLAACDTDLIDGDDPVFYTLTVEMQGEGEILDDTDNVVLESEDEIEKIDGEKGALIKLIANPAEGYAFYKWTGDVETEEKEISFEMNQEKAVTALFLTKPASIDEFRHDNEERVWSVEFSPEGEQIISGGDDSIKIRDPLTGDVELDFTEHEDKANQVTFSSDGAWVASAGGDLGGGKTKVWETESGDIVSEFEHDGAINSIAFSPDDGMLALGGGHNYETLIILNPDTGDIIETFTEDDEQFNSVTFTSDSQKVIAGLDDETVKIWDVQTGDLVTEFTGHSGEIHALDISSDDNLIVSSALGDPIKIWKVDSGAVVTTFDEQGIVDSLTFSPDDSMVVSGSRDGTVKIWDVETGDIIVNFDNHDSGVWAVDISPEGNMAASGDDDGVIKVWEW